MVLVVQVVEVAVVQVVAQAVVLVVQVVAQAVVQVVALGDQVQVVAHGDLVVDLDLDVVAPVVLAVAAAVDVAGYNTKRSYIT